MQDLRIASRASELALIQSEQIKAMIGQGTIVHVNTKGDTNLEQSLYEMKGVGVFVKGLEVELIKGNADLAVHCLKDVPTTQPPGLVIGAVPKIDQPRGDVLLARSGLVLASINDLPDRAIVGTSSLRRAAYLRERLTSKQLQFKNIRGNLQTRLRKLEEGEYDCIILAAAGIHRLDWQDKVALYLGEDDFLYAPAQAALGIECRSDDTRTLSLLEQINDPDSRLRVEAERLFMKTLEGGCKVPIGVHSSLDEDTFKLIGQVWHPTEPLSVRGETSGPRSQAFNLAEGLARQLLEQGAGNLIRDFYTREVKGGHSE
mmetsp:Transcript_13279/g.24908  ORF Transcript_13279/g.24908 Transcript_13279/m.24908 type:complete len:316 (-) Transcript_13279:67-1014(-)